MSHNKLTFDYDLFCECEKAGNTICESKVENSIILTTSHFNFCSSTKTEKFTKNIRFQNFFNEQKLSRIALSGIFKDNYFREKG